MTKQLMKLPPNLKGKYVTRSAFAKLQGERDRLKKDIRILVTGGIVDAIRVKEKYRKEYKFWEDLKNGLREIAKKELSKYKDLGEAKIDSNPKAFK